MSDNTEYVPAGALGPVKRGDLLDIHDGRKKLAGEPLSVVHVGKTHLRTACGRRWTLDRGEWIAEFRGNKAETYPFPWVSKHVPPNDQVARHVRRVVCAAIRAADGSLLLGIRHYSPDMHEQIHRRADGARKFGHRYDNDQGFVDQHGVFMSREEAYRVAEAAGQIAYPEACRHGLAGPKLYSEGLY